MPKNMPKKPKALDPAWPIGVGAGIVGYAAWEAAKERTRATNARQARNARLKDVVAKAETSPRVEDVKLKTDVKPKTEAVARAEYAKYNTKDFEAKARTNMAREIKTLRAKGVHVAEDLPSNYKGPASAQIKATFKPMAEQKQFWRAEFENPVTDATKNIAKHELTRLRNTEIDLVSSMGVDRIGRVLRIKKLATQLSRTGKTSVPGLMGAANVVGTAMDYADFKKGVEMGRTMREKTAPTGPTFAGKPVRRRKKVKTSDPGRFKI